MMEINHNELKKVLEENYKVKRAVCVLGRTGIGKSYTIKEFAKKKAKELGKEFVEWNECSFEKKREIINNPDKYFVYVDFRLSQINPEDLRGLPFSNDGFVEWKPNLWALALSKCSGLLFFDEFNLAMPSIQATIYQIIYDRQIGEIPLHSDVFICLAGNLIEDEAGTYDMPKPIRTRVSLYKLKIPDVEEFTEFMINNKFDSRVIAFLNLKPSYIFKEKELDVISPRSWEFVSNIIKGKNDIEEIKLLSGGYLGVAGAIEFSSFIKLKDKIPNVINVLNGKAEIPEAIDLQYSLGVEIIELINKAKTKRVEFIRKFIKNTHNKFKNFEVFVWILRMLRTIDENCLNNAVDIKDKEMVDIVLKKCGKFIL